MADNPLQPSPRPVDWLLSFQGAGQAHPGRSLAFFDGDATVAGDQTVTGNLTVGSFTSPQNGRGLFNPLDFGADPTGGADCSAAFAAAQAAASGKGMVYVTGGTYAFTANFTTSGGYEFWPGALIAPAPGVTFTFSGRTVFPTLNQFFYNALGPAYGQGSIAFNNRQPPVCYPEWWGAALGNPAVDSAPAIQACINAGCLNIELQAGAYYLSETLTYVGNGVKIAGKRPTQNCCIAVNGGPGTGQIDPNATQLVLTSPSAIGITLGVFQTAKPASLTGNVLLKDFTVVRATAAAPLGVSGAQAISNPASSFSTQASGILLAWCGLCTLDNVWTVEHSLGIYVYACVECWFNKCRGLRYTAGQVPANDYWSAFFQDNSNNNTGFNSGNASIYYDECQAFSNAGVSGAPAYSYNAGFQTYQGFTDTWLTSCETGNTQYGCDAAGRQTTAIDLQTEDLIVINCKFDGTHNNSIYIHQCGPETAVQITNNYCGAITSVGINITNCYGAVTVSNNQVVSVAGNNVVGLYYNNSTGINSFGNICTDLGQPIYIVGCYHVDIKDTVNNFSVTPGSAAIFVTNLNRGHFQPQIFASGPTPITFPCGVAIDSACQNIEVNMTSIQPGHITNTTKVLYNGVKVAALGAFGTNCLASGLLN